VSASERFLLQVAVRRDSRFIRIWRTLRDTIPAMKRQASHWQMNGALCLFLVPAFCGGCETLSSDFEDTFSTIFPPTPTQAVYWAGDRDPDLRRRGTLLLANAPFGGEPPYVAFYRAYAENDSDPLVKAVAIRALAKHGTPDDAPLLARHLRHGSEQVRWEAAKGLQRLHNPVVTSDLLTVLRDQEENVDVRVAAAVALGQYPGDLPFQGLVGALLARELSVNIAARGSLVRITGVDQGSEPRPWLEWYARAADAAFNSPQEFRYPVYVRDRSWIEQLLFWIPFVREQSAPPIGLKVSTPTTWPGS